MRRLEVSGKSFLALLATLFLFVTGVLVPPAGIVLLPFVPQPALVLGLRHGIAYGVTVLLLAAIALAVVAAELALIYGLFALVALLLFALLGRLRMIEFLTLAVTSTVAVVTAGVAFYFFGSWDAMARDFRESLMYQLTSAMRVHEKMGFPQATLEIVRERAPHIVEMLLQLLPALLFVTLSVIVLINVVLLCRRFPERRAEWLSLADLREWQGPEPMVWGLIVFGFALFIPALQWLSTLAVNVLIVIGACYFAQGLTIIAYFFHRNKVPRFLRGVTYVLIFFQQIFTLLVVGLGLFDLWGDFRRLRKNNLSTDQVS